MILKKGLLACAFALTIAAAASVASAQVTIDVGQITCAQFVKYRVTNPDNIAIWLSGYSHGKQGTTIVAREEFKENIPKLKAACALPENSALPVLQVAAKLFATK